MAFSLDLRLAFSLDAFGSDVPELLLNHECSDIQTVSNPRKTVHKKATTADQLYGLHRAVPTHTGQDALGLLFSPKSFPAKARAIQMNICKAKRCRRTKEELVKAHFDDGHF